MKTKTIDQLIQQGLDLEKEHDAIIQEIINDDKIPQEVKDDILKIHNSHPIEEEVIDSNRKIIGYNPETFEPIYEN